jgi:hypothetical protein
MSSNEWLKPTRGSIVSSHAPPVEDVAIKKDKKKAVKKEEKKTEKKTPQKSAKKLRSVRKRDFRNSVFGAMIIKEGELKKRTSGPVRRWQDRYFVLQGELVLNPLLPSFFFTLEPTRFIST